jgi:RNA polymerase sigma-70 factor (ECF subfamily)
MTENEAIQLSEHRGYLIGLAYRMLGEVAEAEDVVQDAYLRWRKADYQVDNPRAYLGRIVTRLCLDRLKEARRHRETYVGAWLPEPLLESYAITTATPGELAEDISLP